MSYKGRKEGYIEEKKGLNGLMFLKGNGVEPDKQKAAYWIRKAAYEKVK